VASRLRQREEAERQMASTAASLRRAATNTRATLLEVKVSTDVRRALRSDAVSIGVLLRQSKPVHRAVVALQRRFRVRRRFHWLRHLQRQDRVVARDIRQEQRSDGPDLTAAKMLAAIGTDAEALARAKRQRQRERLMAEAAAEAEEEADERGGRRSSIAGSGNAPHAAHAAGHKESVGHKEADAGGRRSAGDAGGGSDGSRAPFGGQSRAPFNASRQTPAEEVAALGARGRTFTAAEKEEEADARSLDAAADREESGSREEWEAGSNVLAATMTRQTVAARFGSRAEAAAERRRAEGEEEPRPLNQDSSVVHRASTSAEQPGMFRESSSRSRLHSRGSYRAELEDELQAGLGVGSSAGRAASAASPLRRRGQGSQPVLPRSSQAPQAGSQRTGRGPQLSRGGSAGGGSAGGGPLWEQAQAKDQRVRSRREARDAQIGRRQEKGLGGFKGLDESRERQLLALQALGSTGSVVERAVEGAVSGVAVLAMAAGGRVA
jgi:hypothetical protein